MTPMLSPWRESLAVKPNRLTLVDRGAIILSVLTLLAGRFSLSRWDPRFAALGWAEDVVFWFAAATILAYLLVVLRFRRQASPYGALLLSFFTGIFWLARLISLLISSDMTEDIILWFAIAASIICFLILFSFRRQRRQSTAKVSCWWAWGAMLLYWWIALSRYWSVSTVIDSYNLILILLISVLLFIFISFFSNSLLEISFNYLIKCLFIIALLYALGGVFGGSSGRVAAFGGGPNVFVRIMGVGIICSLYLWLNYKNIRWLLPAPLFLINAILSGSRGGLLAIASVILFLAFFLFLKGIFSIKRLFIFGSIVFLSLSASFFYWPAFASFIQSRYVELTLGARHMAGREVRFEAALHAFRENPIFGIGLDGYHYVTGWGYPHNLVLQIAAEAGIIGLIIFVFLLLGLVLRWFRRKKLVHVFSFSIGLLYFISSMFSGDFYDARMIWFFWALYMLPVSGESGKDALDAQCVALATGDLAG